MILTVRPATLADAEYIGTHLRAEDRREVETATGRAASAVLPESLALSAECYTARKDPAGPPCVIFGVAASPAGGVVWLLATDDIAGAHLALIREARHWLDFWTEKYGRLYNQADSRNQLHLRWIALMGFRWESLWASRNGFMHFSRSKQDV